MEMLSLMIGEILSEEKSKFSGQTFGEYLRAGVDSIASVSQLACGYKNSSRVGCLTSARTGMHM